MSLNKKITDTNIRIGPVRFCYCNVFTPRAEEDGKPGKYSVCAVIPKKDKAAVKLIQEAIEAAKVLGKAEKWNGKIPANVASPLRDGDIDREDDPAYADCYFINCNSKNRPGIRVLENGKVNEALGEEDFYSGCYGAITVNFFPYDSNGNKGVGCGLNNLIKTEDGEKLAGGRSAEEDFADLGDSELD